MGSDSPFTDGSVGGKNNHYKIRGYKEKDANEVISVLSFFVVVVFFFCYLWLSNYVQRGMNSWFSHDVTEIQTKKLSLLLSFHFHVILEHLKTFIQTITNFRFKKGSLFCDQSFAIQDA